MKILVVDDDRVLADVIAFTLRREGFEVIQAYDGESGYQRWQNEQPSLVILDVNMPRMDGFEVCRRIREETNTPILLLTVRGEENDIVSGLEIGADDYIVKPFSPRQLVARLKAVLRRAGESPRPAELKVDELTFVPNRRTVTIYSTGEEITLSPLESRLLEYLMSNPGQVLTYDLIFDHVWGSSAGDRDMLRQLVRRLRNKIESNPSKPDYLQTVPGLGYGFLAKSKPDQS